MKHTAVFLMGLILPVALMTPVIGGARAEGFVDLRLGGGVTEDTDVTVKVGPIGNVSQQTSSATTGFDYGISVGIGGGYWLESLPWLGFALNLSYFKANEDAVSDPLKLDVFPIAGLLMLRYPLFKSDAYPNGRLQPYFGVGPAAFVSVAELTPKTIGLAGKLNDTNTDIGLYAQLGIKYFFNIPTLPGKSYGLFVEQRYTRYDPSGFKDVVDTVPLEVNLDPLSSWHTAAGLAFHF
jgi:hypothetical protein